MPSLKTFNDGDFSGKVFSLTRYDSSLLIDLHQGQNKQLIETGAARLVTRYFEHFVDAKARSNPSMLHHVYEFDQSGKKSSRLFQSKLIPTSNGILITFNFKKARFPNREGYMFYNKAQVMEDGETVIIRPKKSSNLKYRLKNGKFVITKKPSVVENPGGNVAGNFNSEFNEFTGHQAKRVLREFHYFERVNLAIENRRRRIIPQINEAPLANYAQMALADASRIALEAATSGG